MPTEEPLPTEDPVEPEPLFHLELVRFAEIKKTNQHPSLEDMRAVALEASKECHEVRLYQNDVLTEVYRKGTRS